MLLLLHWLLRLVLLRLLPILLLLWPCYLATGGKESPGATSRGPPVQLRAGLEASTAVQLKHVSHVLRRLRGRGGMNAGRHGSGSGGHPGSKRQSLPPPLSAE